MVMWGRSVNVTMDLGTKVYIYFHDESEWSDRVSNLGLWLLSQTLSLMVYAKFQYSLNVLFCEPTEICEYKRKLYMHRVPEFRAMLTFTNYRPLKRSADLAY